MIAIAAATMKVCIITHMSTYADNSIEAGSSIRHQRKAGKALGGGGFEQREAHGRGEEGGGRAREGLDRCRVPEAMKDGVTRKS